MNEWREGRLADCAEVVMGQSPEGEYCNLDVSGTPLLNGPTEFGVKYPTPLQFTSNPKKKSIIDDILFCVRGSTTGRMNWSDQPYAIGRGLAAIRHNSGVDYRYFLRGVIDHYLPIVLASATGSTFPNVSKSQLDDLALLLPPLPEQKAIAAVLSSLDDKIDLLHRQNKTLEAMAETLFRQWFVEEAGEDWETGTLGEIVEFNYGKSLRDHERSGKGYPVYGSSGIVGYHTEYMVEGPGLITGRKGTLGVVSYSFQNFSAIDTSFYISTKLKSKTLIYEYFLLKNANLIDMNTDSAVPGLNRNLAHGIEINKPPTKLIQDFNDHAKYSFHKIYSNQSQIQTLEKLRDNLLPKLMSGEVRVRFEP